MASWVVLTVASSLWLVALLLAHGAQGRQFEIEGQRELTSGENLKKTTLVQIAQNKDLLHHGLRSSLKKVNTRNIDSLGNQNDPIEHWAMYDIIKGVYYGAKAAMSVYSLPDIKANQTSGSIIYVGNLETDQANVIVAGWSVDPTSYGDSQTRLSTSWTADNYQKTGCDDLYCPGFVQVHPYIKPGSVVQPLSTYNGKQYYITLFIFKDMKSGDWVLKYGDGDDSVIIGYWPRSLFTSLADSASEIMMGGSVVFPPNQLSPPMGSGHSASEGYGRAAYFNKIQIIDITNNLRKLSIHDFSPFLDKKECYTVSTITDLPGQDGITFYYGGVGGCSN